MMELLLASVMFALTMTSLYSVFHSALRMRENAYEAFGAGLPRRCALGVMRDDLAGIVAPTGVFGGALTGERTESGIYNLDSLELYASNGKVDAQYPWGNIQRISYSVVDPEDGNTMAGKDLVRSVARNLLAGTEETPAEERLVGGIQSLKFEYYDGEYWQESWDSTTRGNELPKAIRATIMFPERKEGERPKRTITKVVPIFAAAPATTQGTAGQTGGGAGN